MIKPNTELQKVCTHSYVNEALFNKWYGVFVSVFFCFVLYCLETSHIIQCVVCYVSMGYNLQLILVLKKMCSSFLHQLSKFPNPDDTLVFSFAFFKAAASLCSTSLSPSSAARLFVLWIISTSAGHMWIHTTWKNCNRIWSHAGTLTKNTEMQHIRPPYLSPQELLPSCCCWWFLLAYIFSNSIWLSGPVSVEYRGWWCRFLCCLLFLTTLKKITY